MVMARTARRPAALGSRSEDRSGPANFAAAALRWGAPLDGGLMPVKIDLGCGSAKRDGFTGLDYVASPGVDHVLDLTRDRFPFDDHSVDEVFSAHFLEHIESPNHVFNEIGRGVATGPRSRSGRRTRSATRRSCTATNTS